MNTSHTLPSLIPAPASWQPSGEAFFLKDLTRYSSVDPEMSRRIPAARAVARLDPILDHPLILKSFRPEDDFTGTLVFRELADAMPEQYELRVTPEGIQLSAGDDAGFHHGISTLLQLAVNGRSPGEPASLPCGVINDQPQFGWRGMLLDCGRHFMSVDAIKKLLDKLALHKFNVLHWHLTEDQGWRLEIPGYPRLTEIGAWRTDPDGSVHGGFYTAADVREVLAYAADRAITVVPEIEMPGHCQAALASYPGLSCTGGPFEVQTQWGIHEDVYCAGREETFTFLEDVLEYVMELFPGRYIHIGGDEVSKDRWRDCEHCQRRIEDDGLTDEDDLQSWFIGRIGSFLASRGRKLIGWDEILDGGLPGDPSVFTVQAWRGIDEAATAAGAGHDVIVSPTSHAYFDYDPGVLDLLKVFEFRPVPTGLDETAAAHILGGQMNLWTEYIPEDRIDAMLFPRLTAMAEALWTAAPDRDFAEFLDRLDGHRPVLDLLGVEPGAAARPLVIAGQFDPDRDIHRFDIKTDTRWEKALTGRDFAVKYHLIEPAAATTFRPEKMPEDQELPAVTSTDDSWPDLLELPTAAHSGSSFLIQAGLFVDGRPCGAPAMLEISSHDAIGADITFEHGPSERYPGGGPAGLVNGLHGSRFFQDGLWTGLEGHDLDATLDLGRSVELHGLSIRFLQDANAWVFLPADVRFFLSDDAVNWQESGSVGHQVSDHKQEKVIREFALECVGQKARYVRVLAVNRGLCPQWHPGRGKPCWIFADEIVCRGK